MVRAGPDPIGLVSWPPQLQAHFCALSTQPVEFCHIGTSRPIWLAFVLRTPGRYRRV